MLKNEFNFKRMTNSQARSIQSMFKLYDIDLSGRVTRNNCKKILAALGVDSSGITNLPPTITCKELLSYIELYLPEPEPELHCELLSFVRLVSVPDPTDEYGVAQCIQPDGITKYIESIDRPVPLPGEIDNLLMSMLAWDDCDAVPSVQLSSFVRDVTKFAKKTNALRDFR